MITRILQNLNRKPLYTVTLQTGIVLMHYKNGRIKSCKYD